MSGEGTRADRHYVAGADELGPGDRVIVEIDGREICVFNVDGEFHALANYCVHQGGPACEGLLSGTLAVDDDFELVYSREGRVLSCPWHGWEFDVTTGEHLSHTGYRLPTYDVEVEDDGIYVRA